MRDPITDLFKTLEGRFDTEEPAINHQNRFLDKLQNVEQQPKKLVINWWKPLAVAASIALVVVLSLSRNSTPESKDLADVSPEMQKTQEFFTAAIASELFKIQEKTTPANQKIIDDAIVRLDQLEEAYEKLRDDLTNSGDDKRVIYAMIENFQNRIDLLERVVEKIDAINTLNTLQPNAL